MLEVDTPILARHGSTDPHLECLETRVRGPGLGARGERFFLQTSPEFAMKRLLCAGAGPIYRLGPVFRDGEIGRRHNPEFTMLEWYRPGLDHHGLMDEVEALVRHVLERPPVSAPSATAPGLPAAAFERLTWTGAFARHFALDPHTASASELAACAAAYGIGRADELDLDRDGWLDLLLTHRIEPSLGDRRPVFLYDFPASQAALARVRPGSPPVAERFELYVRGVELANGYHELGDAAEQRARFERDNAARRAAGLPEMAPDERLLAALGHGLPPCAGVALGVDRLVMLVAGAASLAEVMAFTIDRA